MVNKSEFRVKLVFKITGGIRYLAGITSFPGRHDGGGGLVKKKRVFHERPNTAVMAFKIAQGLSSD